MFLVQRHIHFSFLRVEPDEKRGRGSSSQLTCSRVKTAIQFIGWIEFFFRLKSQNHRKILKKQQHKTKSPLLTTLA